MNTCLRFSGRYSDGAEAARREKVADRSGTILCGKHRNAPTLDLTSNVTSGKSQLLESDLHLQSG